MACGGSRKSEPVQIGIAKPVKTAIAKERRQYQKPPLQKVTEFHCDECGYIGLNEKHVCIPKPIAWQANREAKCDKRRCPYNDKGRTREDGQEVCLQVKAMHPDKDAIISIGIPMKEAYCPIGQWERVLYKCKVCGSETYNENGTSKCKHCNTGNRACNLTPIFNPIDEPPLEGKSDLAIVTVGVGQKAFEVFDIAGSSMRAYAERCGADFHAIINDEYPVYPLANKFRLAWLTANYRRVIYLDNDVWVRSTAPNLFDAVPLGTVGIFEDFPFTGDRTLFDKEADRIAAEQQVPRIPMTMLNTGVVVFDSQHRHIWMPPRLPAKPTHLSEQSWVEYQIRRDSIPFTKLDQRFNCQWWHPNFKEAERDSHIIHLAACPHEERVYRLRKLAHSFKRR